MSDQAVKQVFQLCSYLLSYPDWEFTDAFDEIETALDSLPDSEMKKELRQFYGEAAKLSTSELIAAYVNTFDFGKKTNLYITYMTNGEQRESGMDLLFLKNYYKLYGFGITDKELPDYLPVMLEFASQVEVEAIQPVFERYLANIKEIEHNLDRDKNLYRHILTTVLLALEGAGISKAARRSEEICSSSFSG